MRGEACLGPELLVNWYVWLLQMALLSISFYFDLFSNPRYYRLLLFVYIYPRFIFLFLFWILSCISGLQSGYFSSDFDSLQISLFHSSFWKMVLSQSVKFSIDNSFFSLKTLYHRLMVSIVLEKSALSCSLVGNHFFFWMLSTASLFSYSAVLLQCIQMYIYFNLYVWYSLDFLLLRTGDFQ